MTQSLKVGDSADVSKTITEQDIETFARLSLDSNPVHLDDEYARGTIFGKRIAHGFYVGSFISAAIAGKLPGPGSIYLAQDLSFKKPVFIGDTITAKVSIIEIPKPGLYKLSTVCTNQNGEAVIEGTALIKRKEA